MAVNIEDVSDELKGVEGYDRESRVARSLTVAKSLLNMDYEVYANEPIVHLEFCRLFRVEYEAATENSFLSTKSIARSKISPSMSFISLHFVIQPASSRVHCQRGYSAPSAVIVVAR